MNIEAWPKFDSKMASIPHIYHEKQSKQMCALHVLNNIFQVIFALSFLSYFFSRFFVNDPFALPPVFSKFCFLRWFLLRKKHSVNNPWMKFVWLLRQTQIRGGTLIDRQLGSVITTWTLWWQPWLKKDTKLSGLTKESEFWWWKWSCCFLKKFHYVVPKFVLLGTLTN